MKKHLFFPFLMGVLLLPVNVLAQSWFTRIDFNETGLPGFPTSTTTLVMNTSAVWKDTFDVLNKGTAICNGAPNAFNYSESGGDGTDDFVVTITRVASLGNNWIQAEGDWVTTSSGSWRSDYSINDQQSRPNDFAYIKVEVEILGDIPTSICPSLFNIRHTSTNGSSEAYEWTLVSINDNLTPAEEAMIASYKNLHYSDLSTSTYFDTTGAVVNIGGATNAPLPNGVSMSEFITGLLDTSGTQGGLVRAGLWSVDAFNTTILDGPEAVTVNPGAGNGATDDNQTLNAITDLGLTMNTSINKITYYFGLTDVAFDTDNDGDTRTNTLPAAGFTYMELGHPDPLTVLSTSGNCNDTSGTAIINIGNGTPTFIVSGDLSDTSASNTISIPGLMQGNYNFTITDQKGCLVSDSVTISPPCAALPIELIDFYGRSMNGNNQLFWKAITENNIDRFEIQRSSNGQDFSTIGLRNGKGGSQFIHTYSFIDDSPLLNVNYYRLKQIDQSYKYSDVVTLKNNVQQELNLIIANSDGIRMNYYSDQADVGMFTLFDMSGKRILSKTCNIDIGFNAFSMDIGLIPSGIYLLQFSADYAAYSQVEKVFLSNN